jgi:hypothetical protein
MLNAYKMSYSDYYNVFRSDALQTCKESKTIDKIKLCQRVFSRDSITCAKGSYKLAQIINQTSTKEKMSKYKIDKFKRLIKNKPDKYKCDTTTGERFDLTPLYQKRRERKAKLSLANKQNCAIAPCIFKKKDSNFVNALVTD